jgi:hypothetical protein
MGMNRGNSDLELGAANWCIVGSKDTGTENDACGGMLTARSTIVVDRTWLSGLTDSLTGRATEPLAAHWIPLRHPHQMAIGVNHGDDMKWDNLARKCLRSKLKVAAEDDLTAWIGMNRSDGDLELSNYEVRKCLTKSKAAAEDNDKKKPPYQPARG